MYSRGMLTWRIMYSIHASSEVPWTPLLHQISQYPPQDSVFQQPAYITGYSHCLSPVSSLPVSTKGLEKIYRTRASGIQHFGEVGVGVGWGVVCLWGAYWLFTVKLPSQVSLLNTAQVFNYGFKFCFHNISFHIPPPKDKRRSNGYWIHSDLNICSVNFLNLKKITFQVLKMYLDLQRPPFFVISQTLTTQVLLFFFLLFMCFHKGTSWDVWMCKYACVVLCSVLRVFYSFMKWSPFPLVPLQQ